jgi:hypothetical protein
LLRVVILTFAVNACTDITALQPPRSIPDPSAADVSADPDNGGYPIVIRSHSATAELPDVSFGAGGYGHIRAQMEYDGYHSSMLARSLLRDDKGSVTQRDFPVIEMNTNTWFNNTFSYDWPIFVSKACGFTLEGDVQYSAWIRNLIGNGMNIDETHAVDLVHTFQGACQPCSNGSVTNINDPAYDPYGGPSDGGGGNAGSTAGCDGDSGSGGGGGGSGTQYSPGDSTGGETVDWTTGVGNGGQSACGSTAVVDIVCIDYYDYDSNVWVHYSCGYATGC